MGGVPHILNHSIERVEQLIAYRFSERSFLETALTHRSVGSSNNERLEFLGDSILNFVIAEALYHQFPEVDEGKLSRLRASLVRGSTLAELARGINLGDFIALGPGELKSGGFRRESILAGTLEAIIGAVLQDGGYEAARTFILSIYKAELDAVCAERELKDPKTRLQEFLQAKRCNLPDYSIVSIDGEGHSQRFTVKCVVEGVSDDVIGIGESRRKAEQNAALNALELLQKDEE